MLQDIIDSLLRWIEDLKTQNINKYVWSIPANATALLTTRVTNELEKRAFNVRRTTSDELTITWV